MRRSSSMVSFGEVRIRSYEQTIGDNPSVSYGAPIALDWDYEEDLPVPLDEYEGAREGTRRTVRQLCLPYYVRKNLLTWRFGHSEQELEQAEREANKAKRQRELTKVLLPAHKIEDLFESARRKTKRFVAAKKNNTPGNNGTERVI